MIVLDMITAFDSASNACAQYPVERAYALAQAAAYPLMAAFVSTSPTVKWCDKL
jgi:hypothetical protein